MEKNTKSVKLYATVASIGLATLLPLKSNGPFQTPGQAIMSSIEYKQPTPKLDNIAQAYETMKDDRLNKTNKQDLIDKINTYKSEWFYEKALDAKNVKEFLQTNEVNTIGMNRLNTNDYLDSLVKKINYETNKNNIIKEYFGNVTSNLSQNDIIQFATETEGLVEQDIKYLSNSKNDFENRQKTLKEYLASEVSFENVYEFIDYKILRTLGYDRVEALNIQKNGFGQFTISHELERRVNKFIAKIDVAHIAKSQDKDPNFIMAVIGAESHFDPKAKSAVNARGYMQLIGSTAKLMNVNINNPVENVIGGTKYLKSIENKYYEYPEHIRRKLELVGYNWGPGNVSKLLTQWRLPKETKNYVVTVHKYYETFNEKGLLN